MPLKTTHKGLKITFIALIAIVVCTLIAIPILSTYYTKVIKEKFPDWISKATNGVYHASVTDVSLNIWSRHIEATGLRLWPDTNRINELIAEGHPPTNTITITIPAISLSGVRLLSIITRHELSCKELTLQQPKAFILSHNRLKDSLRQKSPDSLEVNKEKRSPAIKVLHADRIHITQPDVTYLFAAKDSFYCNMKNGDALLTDWTFDHNSENDTNRFLYASACKINFGALSYSSRKYDWHYIAKTSSTYFESEKNSVVIHDLIFSASLIKTLPGKGTFLKERDSFSTKIAEFKDFNWKHLMNEKRMTAAILQLQQPVMDCYADRTPTDKNWRARYPQQFFQTVPLKIGIDSLYLHNGLVRYTELNPHNDRKGVIVFNNVEGIFKNVVNCEPFLTKNNTCTVHFNARFKNNSPVNTTFKLFLGDTTGRFSVDATIKDVNADQINNDASALSLIEIKSLHVKTVDIHLNGDQNFCQGKLTLLYNDLKVELQRINNDKQMKDRPVKSFIANNLFLFSDNPMSGKEVRHADMYVDRTTNSFFNLIWTTISEGAQKTAIRGEVTKKRVIAEQEGKKKPGLIKRILGRYIKQ